MLLEFKNKKELNVWRFIVFMLFLGVLFVLCCSTQVIIWKGVTINQNLFSFLNAAGTLFLVASGCFFAGGLTGFLFGIPKMISAATPLSGGEKIKRVISQNDNLVQISDWVTKIIVGVGLTQLYNIPHFLIKIGGVMAPSFGGTGLFFDKGRNTAIVTILFFTIIGFISFYLWTRLFFTKMLNKLESDLDQDLRGDVEALKKVNNELQESLVDTSGSKTITQAQIEKLKEEISNVTLDEYLDDPQKGKWGKLSERNGRKLIASILPSPAPNFYVVTLSVISIDPEKPLSGYVKFHLHNTFKNATPVIAVQNGKATLTLRMVYGAFTVGAEADNGLTTLELDLAELDDAPEDFKKR